MHKEVCNYSSEEKMTQNCKVVDEKYGGDADEEGGDR
jgi:hypothetical protein